MLEREARAISSLNHPHICHLYDIASQGGIDYLVTEFLEGETLAEPLRKVHCHSTRSSKSGLPWPKRARCRKGRNTAYVHPLCVVAGRTAVSVAPGGIPDWVSPEHGRSRSSAHTGQLFYYVAARNKAYGQASRSRAEWVSPPLTSLFVNNHSWALSRKEN